MNNDWVYDLETYPNCFTFAAEHTVYPLRVSYEISQYRNDSTELMAFLVWLRNTGARMVGFNSVGFDYPCLHQFIKMGRSDAATLYQKAQAIIGSQDENRFVHRVKPSDCYIPQVDLYLIHHFDNAARMTSLKALEFNMRMDSIEDLPFPVGTVLNPEQIATLKKYNAYDVAATKRFYHESKDMMAFREELTRKTGRDHTNLNDTAIGKAFFVSELEKAGVSCYDYTPEEGRRPRQTKRPVIHLKDAILPWIQFREPEFNRILGWFKEQAITETKGVFKGVTAKVGGLEFVFGTGGIHASVDNRTIEADDEYTIIDLDVTSYYPNLAIQNGFHPEHLGTTFCRIYADLFEQRKQYPKKSAESAMLKLALNGVYGDSNSPFSVFYDPLFTMRITLNGQLLLCLLAERLMKYVDGLQVIQVNTDGITVRLPRVGGLGMLERVCVEWENQTRMNLEEVEYSKMFIRDVNSYIAVREDGGVKRKGAYEYVMGWHQDAGALVIPKVAEKVLVEGAPIRTTVENWPDLMDFMMRIKVPKSGQLQWGEQQVQNTTRYYVAKDGKPLTKWLPPTKTKPDKWRPFSVESGWAVQVCNNVSGAIGARIDFDYYVQGVEKLVMGLR